ncbi:Cna B domain protein [Nitratifractor salsuginis DSM 16511]|uniref:Cna B domain protein n=2 Tax=Nitratifractor salsuginis TaxID=269261 RepID=E6WZK9_NITSE|nr:Cna B domain protein [Nitratifractor salsuginis DSM 16511]
MGKVLMLFSLSSLSLFADIQGVVYKDFNFNGVKDGGDAPVIGATITAVCNDGNSYQAITDADGSYTLTGFPAGSKCRVEADVSSAGLGSASNAVGSSSPLVDIVADGTTHNISAGSPATYCQDNPDVVMAALPGYYTAGNYHAGGGTPPPNDFGTVFKVPAPKNGVFNDNNSINAKRSKLAQVAQTGAIWGAAWQKGGKNLFVSAALKRYVPLKDETSSDAVQRSAGTIYKIDTQTNTVSPFAVVPDVLTSTAADRLHNRDYGYNQDTDVVHYAGRQGLGDLDISEDETKLYTVNLKNKKLVVIDASDGTIIDSISIPNPYGNDCNDEKVRPWALKVRGNDVFIGSVCEDKIDTGDYTTDLGAAIQKYDGAAFQTVARTNSLRYLRARAYEPANKSEGDGYRYTNWSNGNDENYDAPMLTDIEFTNRGDLVLGYTSRQTYNRYNLLRGDIRKMCYNANGSYTDEDSDIAHTDCQTHTEQYDGNPTIYKEFYVGDFYGSNHGEHGHPETASGALAQKPGASNIIVGMIDATNWYQPGAIGNYDNTSGDKIGAQAVIDNRKMSDGGERETYGSKAGGMGDVELLCDPAPIEVGDYVWMDINQNGIQDPNEPAFSDVNVTLECEEGQSYVSYGTATTDSKGHYYFGGLNNVNLANGKTLRSGQNCRLSIDESEVNGKPPTTKDVNNNTEDQHDNDAEDRNGFAVIEFSTTASNNHDLDFGIQPALGCLTGILYEDVNGNGALDSTDQRAPAHITIKITDAYGNHYATETDAHGSFSLTGVPTGQVQMAIDTTDTDIPEGAVWSNPPGSAVRIQVQESTPNGTPNTCAEQDFPYTLPSEENRDPKTTATCANPTSLTWEGANVGTASSWDGNNMASAKTFTTEGGIPVDVTMEIINDNNEEFNPSDSGTNAAFGKPYLTLYLGDQDQPGDGNYSAQDCAAHSYDLVAGESYQLEVDFSDPVILDNWRLRDVDSGDIRNDEPNWNWQDGIKVEAYDANNQPVEVETKIGNSGAGLIVDANGTVHTDPDHYNGGDVAHGPGVTPNSTNGHIVLTSNFIPIKRLVITHLAGPDVHCQTRSALAAAGFAVCKPLHLSGKVYDDADGVASSSECATSDNQVDGTPISSLDGTALNVCLIGPDGKVVDTQTLSNGTYDFDRYIHPNTTYKVIVTQEGCIPGSDAPDSLLPQGWHYEGEQIDPDNNPGHDGTVDGVISIDVNTSNVSEIDFSLNKEPRASGYIRPLELNPGGNTAVQFDLSGNPTSHYIDDLEDTSEVAIRISSISNGQLYYNSNQVHINDVIPSPDISSFSIDPDDGDVVATFIYRALDKACRTSDEAVFEAPFRTVNISGNLYLDMTRDDKVNGTPVSQSCDGETPLYVNLVDSNGNVLSAVPLDQDGSYAFHYDDGVVANSDYTLILSTIRGEAGDPAPEATLPEGCGHYDGENIESKNPDGNDGNADGRIAVRMDTTDINQVNFAITPMVKIGDQLWIEDDNDGIYEPGEEPVVGATVTAVCGDQNFSAETDGMGRYLIEVPANIGTCTVSTPTPPNTNPTVGSEDDTASADTFAEENNHSHNNRGTYVDIGTENILSLDFGFSKAVAIGDTVWMDDNMNGLQDDNHPMSGVHVVLHRADGSVVAETDTNSSGQYYFGNLEAGDYYVSFDDQYYYTDPNVGSDDTIDSDVNRSTFRTETTHLDWGERDMTIDAGITPTAHIGDYFWIDENKNGIQDPGEPPVAGGVVELYDADGNPVSDVHGNHSVTTDSNGKYGFDVEPGQTYKLHFIIPKNLQEDGYVFTPSNAGSDTGDSDADGSGFTVTVTPHAGQNIVTLDAGINCGCDRKQVSNDSGGGSAMGVVSGLLMIFLSAGLGLWMIRREESEVLG